MEGYEVLFDKDNKYVSVLRDRSKENLFGDADKTTREDKDVIEGYTDYSDLILVGTVLFIILTFISTFVFIQYRLVIWEKFLCCIFKKKFHPFQPMKNM